ncbi:translation initiation factor [Segatella paludivivens]|uniref:translation initiation factor n=1 Tax=Segatella paludivivens TaxID=185294 RepID=UPI000373F664|nr:translation initiation factor [Segatella paludivivens]
MAGTDWKSALAALGATSDNVETSENKDVDRKKRVGVVYSTNTDFGYSENSDDEMMTLPKNQQKLRLYMERAGRGGKTVTIVKFFVGSEDDMMNLCKILKQKCGVGGSVKDGEIIIQGDHRERLLDILKKEGYTQTK